MSDFELNTLPSLCRYTVNIDTLKYDYKRIIMPTFWGTDGDGEPEAWVVSSESCSFLSIGAKYVREVQPGEIIEITRRGVQTVSIVERPSNSPPAFCIFEYVYFARADSIFEGKISSSNMLDKKNSKIITNMTQVLTNLTQIITNLI